MYWTKHWNFSGVQKGTVIIVVPIHFSKFLCNLYPKVGFRVVKIAAAIVFRLIPTIKCYCTYR